MAPISIHASRKILFPAMVIHDFDFIWADHDSSASIPDGVIANG